MCYTPDAGIHRGRYQSWSHHLLFIPHYPMAMDGGDNRCDSENPPMALRDRIDIKSPPKRLQSFERIAARVISPIPFSRQTLGSVSPGNAVASKASCFSASSSQYSSSTIGICSGERRDSEWLTC